LRQWVSPSEKLVRRRFETSVVARFGDRGPPRWLADLHSAI
jgi:hypothetical protein